MNVPLNSSAGELTTNGLLDYESVMSYALAINVTDAGLATSTQTLTVDVQDVDEAPTITGK